MTNIVGESIVEDTIATLKVLKEQELKYAVLPVTGGNTKTFKDDRKLMFRWCYSVVDFHDLQRETAAMAMNFADRFLQESRQGSEYRQPRRYQLLCIVSLYVAIKVNESHTLSPATFVEISKGSYSSREIMDLERQLLNALQWKMCPPTALSFVRLFLDLIPELALDPVTKASVYLVARTQVEHAVSDYRLLTVLPSKIAFVSIQNALHVLGYSDISSIDTCALFFSNDFLCEEIDQVRPILYSVIAWKSLKLASAPTRNPNSQRISNANKKSIKSRASPNTPRSVFCHTGPAS